MGPGPWTWSMDQVHGVVHGGPWTGSMRWSMDPGPCFVYVRENLGIDHFTFLCSVTWPLNGSDGGSDLALIQTSQLLSWKCIFLALEHLDLQKKSSNVCIKRRSPAGSLPFKGHWSLTTLKWSIGFNIFTASEVYNLQNRFYTWLTLEYLVNPVGQATARINWLTFKT